MHARRPSGSSRIDSGDAVPGHEIHTRVFLDFGTDPVPDRRTSLIVDPPTGRHPPAAAGAAERRAAVAGSFGPGPFDSCVSCSVDFRSFQS